MNAVAVARQLIAFGRLKRHGHVRGRLQRFRVARQLIAFGRLKQPSTIHTHNNIVGVARQLIAFGRLKRYRGSGHWPTDLPSQDN